MKEGPHASMRIFSRDSTRTTILCQDATALVQVFEGLGPAIVSSNLCRSPLLLRLNLLVIDPMANDYCNKYLTYLPLLCLLNFVLASTP